MTKRKIAYWVIPPEADAEFVAHMEEVLETYEKPYNPNVPVVCMDEQPVQLLQETRSPIAATARHGKRVDDEYERAGTAAIFMCADLNTHTKGACYEAFAPERARALVRRLEFCYTPKHGSWLNIAENALSSLTHQCVADRRFGDIASLREETKAWSNDVNATQRGVDWQMRIDDARTKLKSVYPTIKL